MRFSQDNFGEGFAEGDIIGICCDFLKPFSLSFVRNGVLVGTPYFGIPRADYFPAVCFKGVSAVSILPSQIIDKKVLKELSSLNRSKQIELL